MRSYQIRFLGRRMTYSGTTAARRQGLDRPIGRLHRHETLPGRCMESPSGRSLLVSTVDLVANMSASAMSRRREKGAMLASTKKSIRPVLLPAGHDSL